MLLISNFMFDTFYKPQELLEIDPYAAHNYHSNFYYFRLGGKYEGAMKSKVKLSKLTIPKNTFVRIWSLEKFKMSNRVLGIFGHKSTLMERGIELINSPSIDPGFEGNLSLGIKNNTTSDVHLSAGEEIGKVLFFDVTDTNWGGKEPFSEISNQKQMVERRNVVIKNPEALLKMDLDND